MADKDSSGRAKSNTRNNTAFFNKTFDASAATPKISKNLRPSSIEPIQKLKIKRNSVFPRAVTASDPVMQLYCNATR